MTVTIDVGELTSTLSAMLSAHGFDASPLEVADGSLADRSLIDNEAAEGGLADAVLLPALLTEGDLPVAIVALRDDAGDDADALRTSVAELVAADTRTVDNQDPVAGVGALLDGLPAPLTEAVAITDGDTVIGFVGIASDRRGDDGSADGAGDGAADPGPVGEPFAPDPIAAAPRTPMPIGADIAGLELLRRVGLDVAVELGRTRMTLDEVMGLDIGSVIELDRSVGAPVDVRVNDTLIARGEVVVFDGEYAVRLTEIIDRQAG